MIPARGAGYALFGFAGLLLAVAVVSGWRGISRMAGHDDETAAVGAAAAAFVVDAGTYDWRDLAGYPIRLQPLTTGGLRHALTSAVIDPAARTQQRSVVSAVDSVSVTSLSDAVATATVTATQLRSWQDPRSGRQAERVRQRTSCRLVLEDGRWLVAEIHLLSEEPVRSDETR